MCESCELSFETACNFEHPVRLELGLGEQDSFLVLTFDQYAWSCWHVGTSTLKFQFVSNVRALAVCSVRELSVHTSAEACGGPADIYHDLDDAGCSTSSRAS